MRISHQSRIFEGLCAEEWACLPTFTEIPKMRACIQHPCLSYIVTSPGLVQTPREISKFHPMKRWEIFKRFLSICVPDTSYHFLNSIVVLDNVRFHHRYSERGFGLKGFFRYRRLPYLSSCSFTAVSRSPRWTFSGSIDCSVTFCSCFNSWFSRLFSCCQGKGSFDSADRVNFFIQGFRVKGAKLRVCRTATKGKSTQLSPSLTRKPCKRLRETLAHGQTQESCNLLGRNVLCCGDDACDYGNGRTNLLPGVELPLHGVDVLL